MEIGVISDTHLEAADPLLEEVIEKVFKDVDLILHGGDLHALKTLDVFRGKEVIAVAGNCDSPEVKQSTILQRIFWVGIRLNPSGKKDVTAGYRKKT